MKTTRRSILERADVAKGQYLREHAGTLARGSTDRGQRFRGNAVNPIIAPVIAIALAIATIITQAAEFHVAPGGSDSNAGTAAAPVATVAQAIQRAGPGETCILHGGDYFGPVACARSGAPGAPITLGAAPGERPRLIGGLAVRRWRHNPDGSWQATVRERVIQVIAGEHAMVWARHPNLTWSVRDGGNWMRRPLGTGKPPPEVDWSGAWLSTLDKHNWVLDVKVVDRFVQDERAVLMGVVGLLDAPGEWVQRGDELLIRLPAGATPDALNILAITHERTVDLRGRSHIRLIGLDVIGGAIDLDEATDCLVQACRNLYPRGPFLLQDGWRDYIQNETVTAAAPGWGLRIGGSGNVVCDCEVAHSWGDGITVYGRDNTITNCHVFDCNWSASDCSNIAAGGSGHRIMHNTLHTSGRSLLVHRKTPGCRIAYNDLYDYGHLTSDLGATYTFKSDGTGGSIDHNWVHDTRCMTIGNTGLPGAHNGIYVDDGSSNMSVHHNVVWNVGNAIIFNTANGQTSRNHQAFHNTVWMAAARGFDTFDPSAVSGVRFWNNLLCAPNFIDMGNGRNDSQDNLVRPRDTILTPGDFRPLPGSPAINAGKRIAAINDDAVGEPDIGASEHGGTDWVAGWDPLPLTGRPGAALAAPAPGDYAVGLTISLRTTTPDARIHYTTDGTAPTATSPRYQTLLPLAQGTLRVRAAVVAPGGATGPELDATWTVSPLPGVPLWKRHVAAEGMTICGWNTWGGQGFDFTPKQDITLTHLGHAVIMTQRLPHVVRLYHQRDKTLLAEVTVDPAAALDEHGCRYVALNKPIQVKAGTAYRLVTYNRDGPDGGDWMKHRGPLPPGSLNDADLTLNGFASTDGNGYPERPAGVSDDQNLAGVLPSLRYAPSDSKSQQP